MKKRIVAAGLGLVLATTVMAQNWKISSISRPGPSVTNAYDASNYTFPSPWNPGGYKLDDPKLKQYVLISWDDNGYSGMSGTIYEGSNKEQWVWHSYPQVDGSKNASVPINNVPTIVNRNPDDLSETGPNKMGINWAVKNIAEAKKAPMTFNMITGLFLNTKNSAGKPGWPDYESQLGFWPDYDYETSPATIGNLPISWGREMRIVINGVAHQDNPTNYITKAVKAAIAANCEIGNHTIDHLEVNSTLPGGTHPNSNTWGFGSWGNDNDGIFRNGFIDVNENPVPWSNTTYPEAQMYGYGTKPEQKGSRRGWGIYSGKWLNKETWKGLLELGEYWLRVGGSTPENSEWGGLGIGNNLEDVVAFRAPRLEVNSALYYALRELGYWYDTGLQEGYEDHVDGYNFLWPYTLDNGVRDSWQKQNIGDRIMVDSTPTGLWQIPVNCMMVPKHLRSGIIAKYNQIGLGDVANNVTGVGAAKLDETWNGKITGFDFNMFILHGMSKAEFLETMDSTLARRKNGNKAPIQFGAHTDYYTPIYDNATLSNDHNKNSYGLILTGGGSGTPWNTYKTRQEAVEEFVDMAKNKYQAEFVTGKTLVTKMREMYQDNIGRIQGEMTLNSAEFVGYNGKGETIGKSFTGSTPESGMTHDVAVGVENQPRFVYMLDNPIDNMTHISLDYKSRTATAVNLLIDTGKTDAPLIRQVTLAHRFSPVSINGNENSNWEHADWRNSGRIPLSSFDFEPHYKGKRDYSAIDPKKIIGIEIVPLAPWGEIPKFDVNPDWKERTNSFELGFAFQDIKIYTGTPFDFTAPVLPPTDGGTPGTTSIVTKVKANMNGGLALAGVTRNALRLNIAQSGMYNVKIFSANGRLLQSFDATSLNAGVNTLKLNNFASGVYMIKVQGINTKQQLTKSALIH